jgi:intein/homing endonuclease
MKIKNVIEREEGTGEITIDYANKTFEELLAFQGYGFCLGYDTVVELPNGKTKLICELVVGDKVRIPDNDKNKYANVLKILPNGEKDAFLVTLENGKEIKSTMEHPFLCSDGKNHTLYEIIEKKLEIMCE